MGISHINPLITKPNKVGISLQNAYAYVLFGSLMIFALKDETHCLQGKARAEPGHPQVATIWGFVFRGLGLRHVSDELYLGAGFGASCLGV